ncbi:tetraspanin-8-like, partial [Clarias magur]
TGFRTGAIALSVTGFVVVCIAFLGTYSAYKESKCPLIVFFTLTCLVTAGILCIAILLALNRTKMTSIISDKDDRNKFFYIFLIPFQTRLQCCGLFKGYRDWRKVPDSCNCEQNADDTCETIPESNRSVWSQPCGPILTEYVLVFTMAVCFTLAALAIFGIVIIVLGLVGQPYAAEANAMTGVIIMYVIGSIIFCFAVLGAYGANKESKCALIVFFTLMCLAAAGLLRIAIPLALNHLQISSNVGEYLRREITLNKDQEQAFKPVQEHFHCCGLFNGYTDWRSEVPDSCNCVNPNAGDTCERITTSSLLSSWEPRQHESRRVWSKPCGPIMIKYIDYVLFITMAVLFTLAALA